MPVIKDESPLGPSEEQKEAAANTVAATVRALRKTAEELAREGQPGASRYVSGAADRIERVSADLRRRGIESSLHEIQSFARREPAVFFGGAVTAGFLLSRFLTSSGARAEGEASSEEVRHVHT